MLDGDWRLIYEYQVWSGGHSETYPFKKNLNAEDFIITSMSSSCWNYYYFYYLTESKCYTKVTANVRTHLEISFLKYIIVKSLFRSERRERINKLNMNDFAEKTMLNAINEINFSMRFWNRNKHNMQKQFHSCSFGAHGRSDHHFPIKFQFSLPQTHLIRYFVFFFSWVASRPTTATRLSKTGWKIERVYNGNLILALFRMSTQNFSQLSTGSRLIHSPRNVYCNEKNCGKI